MTLLFETHLSDRDLELMHRRTEAASRGPWISYVVGRDMEAGLNCIEVGYYDVMEVLGATVADQDFIANAREDMPRLIREVRQLRAQLTIAGIGRAEGSRTVAASSGTISTVEPTSPATC